MTNQYLLIYMVNLKSYIILIKSKLGRITHVMSLLFENLSVQVGL